MGHMSMISKSMLNKEVVVVLSEGVMQGIEMKGILRGYDLVLDTIQLEKNGHVHTYDEGLTSIEVVEERTMKLYRIEVKGQFIDYDEFTAIVVIAETPEQAREDAYQYVLNRRCRGQENADCFLNPEKSTIKELPVTRGVIAAEDLNG